MRESRNKTIMMLVFAGVIAAMYVVLTFAFKPISMGAVQCRIAEVLCVLPIFTPAAVPGLFIGCLIGNMISGAVIWDIIFGSLATLAGAVGTYVLRKQPFYISLIPPILANTIVVPLVLKYGYGVDMPLILSMFFIFVGEFISIGVLGSIFIRIAHKSLSNLFK